MTLYLLQDASGNKLPVCECPSSLLSTRAGLTNFLRLHAGRVFGGREGRDWRVCPAERNCLVPLTVNQLVPIGHAGHMEYGQQLVIE